MALTVPENLPCLRCFYYNLGDNEVRKGIDLSTDQVVRTKEEIRACLKNDGLASYSVTYSPYKPPVFL